MKKSKYTHRQIKPTWVNNATLIPATSLKGALAHRVAFHYNKLMSLYATNTKQKTPLFGSDNPAVKALFGAVGNEGATRGNVIFSDIITKDGSHDKLLNHVSIDRFTGGTIEGALFTEKAVYAKGSTYHTSIYVSRDVTDEKIISALEATLDDLCSGLLPLGGGNNRGNGLFTGSYVKI